VIKRFEIVNALLSPVLQRPGSWGQLFAQVIGVVLLAMIERRVLKVLRGKSYKWWWLVALAWVLVIAVRVLLGFVFSRAVGWQYPNMFINDSVHECNSGMWLVHTRLYICDDLKNKTKTTTTKQQQ
jgi:hypothetical protein